MTTISMQPGAMPATQHAIQFVAPGRLVHNRDKPVPVPGPTQLILRVEAVGVCFSDTKLLKAFDTHLRKAAVIGGIDPAELAQNPSYVPGAHPTVPGHECAGRIVAVGEAVRRHRVGERVLVQTDYRHLPTPGSNAAFGYDFEGGMQEYVLLDERMILEPGTGERFLIPVGEEPSSSAVALLEPWACVEAAYSTRERSRLATEGRLLVVADPGHAVRGLVPLVTATPPAAVTAVLVDGIQRAALDAALFQAGATTGPAVREAGAVAPAVDLATLPAESFDDIVYFGADPDRIEALQGLLAPRGVLDVVLGSARVGRQVAIDVGRIHYDLVRWVGTTGDMAADGYAMAPADGELRDGDRVAVVGAAGPMGFMHVVRAETTGRTGLSVTAIDIDDERLARLAEIAAPLAADRGADVRFVNGRTGDPGTGHDYVAVMVPSPAIVAQAIAIAGRGCRINLFAGFAVGTRADVDLDAVLAKRAYLFGTSGSEIPDMKAVLARLERGELDTNVSVGAVAGMEGVREALDAVESRASGGKIVVYPTLHELGFVPLSEMAKRLPAVAARLDDGRWTRAAEEALLAGCEEAADRT